MNVKRTRIFEGNEVLKELLCLQVTKKNKIILKKKCDKKVFLLKFFGNNSEKVSLVSLKRRKFFEKIFGRNVLS